MEPYMFKFSEGIILNQEESLHLQLKLQVSEINVESKKQFDTLWFISDSQITNLIWAVHSYSGPEAELFLNCQ